LTLSRGLRLWRHQALVEALNRTGEKAWYRQGGPEGLALIFEEISFVGEAGRVVVDLQASFTSARV